MRRRSRLEGLALASVLIAPVEQFLHIDAIEGALRHLLEKLNDYASRVGDRVLVIADEVPDQQAHAMRMASYQSLTTGGYKPSKLSRIEFPITFGKSAESPGIQCADMIVYLYRRIDANEQLDDRAANTARDLWTVVKPLRPVVRRWDP